MLALVPVEMADFALAKRVNISMRVLQIRGMMGRTYRAGAETEAGAEKEQWRLVCTFDISMSHP